MGRFYRIRISNIFVVFNLTEYEYWIYLVLANWLNTNIEYIRNQKLSIRIRISNIRCLIFEYSNIQIYSCYTGSSSIKGCLSWKVISNQRSFPILLEGRKGRVESWIFLYRKLFLGSMPKYMALCVSLWVSVSKKIYATSKQGRKAEIRYADCSHKYKIN